MSETSSKCNRCGAPLPPDAPEGLCPRCLVALNLATQTEVTGETDPHGPAVSKSPPAPVSEIAKLFPQLEILECLGRGGMGAVYKARQPRLDRLVALKILSPEKQNDSKFAERFEREARMLARLHHPNIVTVYDFGEVQGNYYLLMEFVDGLTLRQLFQARKLSPAEALKIVPEICKALQYAHEQGIVHRDIKPENILLDKQGRVKIADFGIAKMLGVEAGQQILTGAKDVVGTPHYMAPEQIEKPMTVDHRADIYSLGVVFYEMLTGELPLGKFQPPSQKVQIDVRLDEVVLHALEKEPERRYQQASQMKTAVETIAGTAPPSTVGFTAKAGTIPPAFSIPAGQATSDKIILPAFLLAFFFGVFGAHLFYVGKTGTAILQLCTLGGLGIWATIDWILILCKAFTDGQGRRITNWLHPKTGELQTDVARTAGTAPIAPAALASTSLGKQPGTSPQTGTIPPAMVAGGPAAFSQGKVTAPAVGLMVAALWKLLSAFSALFLFTGGSGWLDRFPGFGNFFGAWGSVAIFSIVLFKVIPGLLILFGGFQMLQRRSYAWAIAAGIISIVSCSLIGLPIGIWALIVLARDDVKSAFGCALPGTATSAPQPDRFWRRFAVVTGCIVLIPIAIAIIAAALYVLALHHTRDHGPELTAQNLPQAGIRQEAGEFRKDSSQSFPLNAEGSFSLDNVKGRIEIHGWSSNVVVINAAIHGKTSESVEAVKINIDSGLDRAIVHTEQPSSVTGFPWSWLWFKNDKRNDASVDYTIQVPQHARLADISSVNGRIVIDGISGDIAASTVNGETQIKDAARNLRLSTVNGRITADMILLGGGQSVSLDAVNGKVELALPDDADANFSASTVNGSITSEFPSLKAKKEFPVGNNLKGSLGNGSASVKVSTVNGGISFRRGKPASPASPASNSNSEAYYIGQASFPEGDSIEITSVKRTKDRMTVKGHYNLVSRDNAELALYITSTNKNVPEDPQQRLQIAKGRGDFELIDSHLVPGLPHASMYTDGGSFAALYFGTKAEALEESKASWITNAPPASNPNSEAEKAAVSAAQKWLALIDDGRYSESWNEAAAIFQGGVTEPNWANSMETFRKPLGDLVSRKLKSAQRMTEMPGAPDGQYVVMQFETSFANKKSAIETITFMLEKDGQWKSAGYFIK